jgi:hypothetical protein
VVHLLDAEPAGAGNTIPYNSTTMENWWTFVGDWDAAIAARKRLYR